MLLRPMFAGHENEMSPILKQFLDDVAEQPVHTGESLLDTWTQRDLIRSQVFAQMNDYPIVLCPVAAIPAFRHGERNWQIEGQNVPRAMDLMLHNDKNTPPVPVIQPPVVVVPGPPPRQTPCAEVTHLTDERS